MAFISQELLAALIRWLKENQHIPKWVSFIGAVSYGAVYWVSQLEDRWVALIFTILFLVAGMFLAVENNRFAFIRTAYHSIWMPYAAVLTMVFCLTTSAFARSHAEAEAVRDGVRPLLETIVSLSAYAAATAWGCIAVRATMISTCEVMIQIIQEMERRKDMDETKKNLPFID